MSYRELQLRQLIKNTSLVGEQKIHDLQTANNNLTVDLKNQANEVQRLTNLLTDINNDLKSAQQLIQNWEKVNAEDKQSLAELTTKLTTTDNQLESLGLALNGDTLGKPKEAKEFTLRVIKSIRDLLIIKQE